MKVIEIKTEKQENGLYGTPLKCYEMIGTPPISDHRKYMLFSAIVIAVDERYDRYFNLKFYDDGFLIQIESDPGSFMPTKSYFMRYDKYEYIGDTLYEFNDNDERTVFLRKHKLKELENAR